MANSVEIKDALCAVSHLWGAEHAEHDDQGAQQIEKIVKALRRFSQHEAKEHQAMADGDTKSLKGLQKPVRESSYQLADGRHVYYDDGHKTLRDAVDLYTVLNDEHKTGSPNLENGQARMILDRLQTGGGLGETHLGTLQRLLVKHKQKIDALRKSPDRDGQDMLHLDSPGPDSRIITNPGGSM